MKTHTFLIYIPGILYILSVFLAILSFSGYIDYRYAPLITAMVGFAINLFKIGLDNKSILQNQNQILEVVNKFDYTTILKNQEKIRSTINDICLTSKKTHDCVEDLSSNNLNVYQHILFSKTKKNSNVTDVPHLNAFLNAGERFAYTHLKSLTTNYRRLTEGQPIAIRDIPITADFLSNIVRSLDPIEQSCVWMGTSRVVDPKGWNLSNDPLFRFAESIRDRAERKDEDKEKLHVYRLYTIDTNNSEKAINDRIKSLYRIHLEREVKHRINIKILYTPKVPLDFSLVFIPIRRQNFDYPIPVTPNTAYDVLERNGWRIICGIHWEIRNYHFVDGAIVYPEDDNWVKNQYLKFRRMWIHGIDVKVGEEPHFTPNDTYI